MVIGLLNSGDPSYAPLLWSLESELPALGWTIGRDVLIEARYGNSNPADLDKAARELVALNPDVLFTGANTGAIPLRRLTDSIPIVVSSLNDPVGLGMAASLARPRGNVTGIAAYAGGGLLAKRLQMLTECEPRPRRVAVLWAPRDSSPALKDEMMSAGRTLGLSIQIFEVEGAVTFKSAFERIAAWHPDAMAISGLATVHVQRHLICAFALEQRLPAIYSGRPFVQAGLLMAYGPDLEDAYRRAAGLIDRILRGTKAGDLPIQQPNGYELAVNLRTARSIGVKIPPSLVQRADLVIE